MSSRERILSALRAQTPAPVAHPGVLEEPLRYAQPIAQFGSVLESVGGRCLTALDAEEAAALVADLDTWRTGTRHAVAAQALPLQDERLVDLGGLAPHDCASLDCLVAPGVLAVAENGAVWVDGAALPQRVALFLCQHLVLVVPARAMAHNMHEAYGRLRLDGSYGCFVSGPSKTADIEQSLVIGAHGPLSLAVVLVGE